MITKQIKWIREMVFTMITMAWLSTILQTPTLFSYMRSYPIFKIFVLVGILVMGLWMYWSIRNLKAHQGVLYYCIQKFRASPIPRAAKYVIIFVMMGNLLAISFGKQLYPFYDVGMFRWPKDFVSNEKTAYEVKYFYWQNGHYKILELRKECFFLLAEHFHWEYDHDFAYAAAYFHKGEKENFEFISHEMKDRGIDTLWAGVQSVNFETKEVSFNPDYCHAIEINQREDLYYGPLYIPDYQLQRCDEQK